MMNRDEFDIDFARLPAVEEASTIRAECWIALGHLRSKKKEAFVSLVTALSIFGVVAGVALLNCVIAVMTGFEVDLREKILGANAHIVVLRYGGSILDYEKVNDQVASVSGVEAASPFIYTEMMVKSAWGSTGIIYKGVDPELTGEVTGVRDQLVEGLVGTQYQELSTDEERAQAFAALLGTYPPNSRAGLSLEAELEPRLPGIVIGKELQGTLQVEVGDQVQVVNPLGSGAGPMGMPTPSVRRYRVGGIFDSGMYEYDTKWTYVANAEAQEFLNLGPKVTGIEVKVSNIDAVERVSDEIESLVGYPLYTRHWKNLNQKLFEALELEKWVMGIILMMVVVNAGLLIASTLIMLVLTKGREIAILKAMGATAGSIMRVFVIEGSVIGVFGSVGGTILGLFGCAFLAQYEYPLETDVYYLATLPVVVEPINVAIIGVSAFIICFLATLYPAWQAAQLDPVEGLRYE
ncbi:MAG: ABC transporter permease [Proteobacteria bacterium]|nr:ABC transporter permease [Pseudomonadota bacterium]